MGEIDGQARVSENPNPASDNTVFDASQYDFFGKDVVEEVELGGLDDDCDDASLVREEGEGIGSLADIDDLSSTFSKLNRTSSDPRSTRQTHGRGPFSRESSLTTDWAQEPNLNWIDQQIINAENSHDSKLWSSQTPLYRTSSYPRQPHPHYQPQNIATEPVNIIPKSSFPSNPPHVGLPIPFSPPNISHFSGMPHGIQFPGENIPQFGPQGFPVNTRHPNPNNWPGLHNPNGLMHPRMHHMQPSPPHFSNFNSHPPPMLGMRPMQRGRQNPRFQGKYMSSEEIDNIIRIQHAATHSNDPYVDDYYHQACLAKKSLGSNSRVRHHFSPISIQDSPLRSKANSEPHAYLQVDALGRLPFSSIRRPRPLLEVDPPSNPSDETSNPKSSIKPLEQEPMLAARIAIEDGLSLLLDVDDIERWLQFSSVQDGGAQLRQRRQGFLEELAASLQLVDPLGRSLAPKDDLVFLRIVSLPKGRKLLSRYIKLIHPSDDLARIVCMAFFRHLRFLFGDVQQDVNAAKTTRDLMVSIASTVSGMDLGSLGMCLAAIVCSSEKPPLRPLGSPAGDGATVIVKSVLERATQLFTDRNATAANYSVRNLWQESFNAFFVLLTDYCVAKYDGVVDLFKAASIVGPEFAQAISREIPVELLSTSLPHTNEGQRKILLDFAQRSMPVASYGPNGTTSESVHS